MVAHNLFKSLSPAGRERLHYFWYVAKDQTEPIVQHKKRRSCHIKLMIVDEHIGIVGNGNQDTQSWYHSQEINVMLDSPDVCRSWMHYAVTRTLISMVRWIPTRESGRTRMARKLTEPWV